LATAVSAQEKTGTIKGKIADQGTQERLIGANVLINGTTLGASSDIQGQFVIPDVLPGSYLLRIYYIGYEPLSVTDVIVRANRVTFLDVLMKPSAIELSEVVVTGGFFATDEKQPTGVIAFAQEEIRRAPGSAGDVSRILYGLPSLAKVNDQSNSLIVRGGSPMENSFFVDQVEIPNINHFPTQGSSGGPIGILNVDFLKDVRFSAGGFSPEYGDRLSSVMVINFRDGNRDEFDGQLDLNFAGFGGAVEGPVFGKKGSAMLSIRRSYLDLLVKTIDVGTSVAPRYGDLQAKAVYDINANHRLSVLLIAADDHNNPDLETARENDMTYYGRQDIYEYTSGVNWRSVWSGRGFSHTSVSYSASRFREAFNETSTAAFLFRNRSAEGSLNLRNLNHFELGRHAVEFGGDLKWLHADYDNAYAEYTDAFGNTTPGLLLDRGATAFKVGGFAMLIVRPTERITTSAGARVDHFTYTRQTHVSPRASASYQVARATAINVSVGMYRQALPPVLLMQHRATRRLTAPRAVHLAAGTEHLLTESTKLTAEVYHKSYRHFPVDPAQPSLFLIDEIFFRHGFYTDHAQLTDRGAASTRGVEVTLQKKLARDFYGLASASYFRSRYRGSDGVWRNRVFDNRYIFTVEGGYKPGHRWEVSARWIYAGGAPYTPLDLARSAEQNRAVLDENRVNSSRYPDYHSLNIRMDRRFQFTGSNLVAYVSVWNAYDRKNVAGYFWNAEKQKQDVIYQWRLLPIFGFEYEF
jgi:hypothetical protein